AEEPFGALIQVNQRAIQIRGREELSPRDGRRIFDQLLYLKIADAYSEILSRHVFNLMCFVKDDGVVIRQNARVRIVPHRQVSEEQMMIHDDNIASARAAMHLGDE